MFSKETTHWHRNVTQVGNRTPEKALQEELKRLYPEARYPFHIDVWGESDTEVRVCISRRPPYADVCGTAVPGDFAGDACAAILHAVFDLVEDFTQERRAERYRAAFFRAFHR